MTLEQLTDKVQVHWKGYGSYSVSIKYRNKYYHCTSHNSMAWDCLKGSKAGYTLRQALESFYNECKHYHLLK